MSKILFQIAKPFLHGMDPENAHRLTIRALQSGIAPCADSADNPALRVSLWGRTFENPVGLAAGFDKNAEVIAPLFRLGFGFVEVGTVTPLPQEGNPRPRIFRDTANEAVINRMGFPNSGLAAFRHNIERFLEKSRKANGVLGINIGMNKTQTDPAQDYCALVRALGPYADYLTLNISSPNTPGLRNLQERENLLPLLERILEERARTCGAGNAPPLLVKLAPDLSGQQQESIAKSLIEARVDGVILGNTTLDRPSYLSAPFLSQAGGLSGRPLTQKSTGVIRNFYKLTGGALPIVGVGGISSAQDAYDKIKAGASLVQLYSALVFQGPGLVPDILKGIGVLLKQDGYDHISQAVGKGA